MKGIVVYYSATGNTQKIAKRIHLGMKGIFDQCDIGMIKDLDPGKMANYDLITIGGPMFYWRESSEVSKNCIECSMCEFVCPNDAIVVGEAGTVYLPTEKTINIKKCKYPQCTVCIDNCNNDSIDFSQNPPVFKNNRERDDLCWLICPEGAIEITNLEETHGTLKMLKEDQGVSPHYPSSLLQQTIDAEKEGKFRRLISIDAVGWDNLVMYMKRHPRFDIDKSKKDD